MKFPLLLALPCLGAMGLLNGCGGGGSSGPSDPTVPTPYDGAYTSTYTPSDEVPADGKAPTGTLSIVNGKATFQTTFYLQQSVVDAVQAGINLGLTNAGYASAINDNLVPTSILFEGSALVDGTGKITLKADKKANICGTGTVTITPTLNATGTPVGGQGTYSFVFPNNLYLHVRGRKITIDGSCNNLPLRQGTATFTR